MTRWRRNGAASAAERGYLDAQLRLADYYVEQGDIGLARAWLEMASGLGSQEAADWLDQLNKRGGPKWIRALLEWFR